MFLFRDHIQISHLILSKFNPKKAVGVNLTPPFYGFSKIVFSKEAKEAFDVIISHSFPEILLISSSRSEDAVFFLNFNDFQRF